MKSKRAIGVTAFLYLWEDGRRLIGRAVHLDEEQLVPELSGELLIERRELLAVPAPEKRNIKIVLGIRTQNKNGYKNDSHV